MGKRKIKALRRAAVEGPTARRGLIRSKRFLITVITLFSVQSTSSWHLLGKSYFLPILVFYLHICPVFRGDSVAMES